MSVGENGPHLFLPDSAREAMRAPLGPIIQNPDLDAHLKAGATIVTVGDMVTMTLVNKGFKIALAIFDYKTKRTEKRDFREGLRRMDGEWIRTRSPPAMITRELWDAVVRAFSNIRSGNKVRMEVEGEEDLAAIPAILLAPDGTVVLYGMPGQGMVVVTVDDSSRKEAGRLLKMMEPRKGWK